MAKRAIVFGHHLNENVFYPVPHRQYVFSIPIMLRIYFKYDRSLLTGLCQCAYRSLLTFLREVVGLKNGVPGVVLLSFDRSDKLFSGIDLEIFLFFPLFHSPLVNHFLSFFNVFYLFDVQRVSSTMKGTAGD